MPAPYPTLQDCWAKTFPEGHPREGHPALTARDHCLIVGAVAELLLTLPISPDADFHLIDHPVSLA